MIVRRVRWPHVIRLISSAMPESEQELQVQRDRKEQHGPAERDPEIGVGEDPLVIPEADPIVQACLDGSAGSR